MEGCSEIIGYEDLDAHAKECFEQVVTCDHCEEEIIRAKLSEHQVRPMVKNLYHPIDLHMSVELDELYNISKIQNGKFSGKKVMAS